jgi:hypothetical protein
MPNPHSDNESVIERLRRLRDMLLGREPSKITEIDEEVDALALAQAAQLSAIADDLAANTTAIGALTASQAAQDVKLDAILALLNGPITLDANFTFQPPIPKEN